MLKRHYIFVTDCYGIKRQHHVIILKIDVLPFALSPSKCSLCKCLCEEVFPEWEGRRSNLTVPSPLIAEN